MAIKFSDIKARVKCTDVAKHHGVKLTQKGEKDGLPQWRGPCPIHKEDLSINDGKGFQCFKSGDKGDVISLHAHLKGLKGEGCMQEAAADLARLFLSPDTSMPGTDSKAIEALRDRLLDQATEEDSLPFQAAAAAELLLNILKDMERGGP